ncbi:FCD domain-containing protein [Pseudomonas stutzeri]|nr:FadR/GntR family transcriptional regulator [Stutzerimonas stutzeri]MBK3867394.1 FCD domain-containing protein [Stutzerimonas stutzeri]
MSLGRTARSSLVERVIEQLRSQIVAGAWPCGARIPTEGQLSTSLGVGRNTIREAVRALVHTGVLEVRQGAGTFVRSIRDPAGLLERLDHAALHDQLEVRRALEVEAARLAASRRTEEDLRAIHEALAARGSWCDEASLEDFVERDARFHLNIVRASHNSALVEMYQFFWAGLQNTIAKTECEQQLPEPTYQAHAAVYDAILCRSPEQAALAASELLSPSLESLAKALEQDSRTSNEQEN